MKTLTTSLNQRQCHGFYEITQGIDVDQFLYQEEIQVQKAWVKALGEINLLTQNEVNSLLSNLDIIFLEIQQGNFPWLKEDEDIHMSIERALTDRVGESGKKIHLGRSRNDLIATTLKIYFSKLCTDFENQLVKLVSVFLSHAERDIEILLPGQTHSQAAQPLRMAQLWNFHALNFLNDIRRFHTCRHSLMRVMPLGSGAIAGTHVSVDLDQMARSLGFQGPPLNSVHGVSDRDGQIELAQVISILGVHITRLCEDVIQWSSFSVKILELPGEWSSGSSMMPNKKNPDFFEIVRAKGKKMLSLSSEVTLMSVGITSGYASDFHEQKRVLLTEARDALHVLKYFSEAITGLVIDKNRAQELLGCGHILATDLANDLVLQGMSFREAYRAVASELELANKKNRQIGTESVSYEASVESRNNRGGTSRERVKESIKRMELEMENLGYPLK